MICHSFFQDSGGSSPNNLIELVIIIGSHYCFLKASLRLRELEDNCQSAIFIFTRVSEISVNALMQINQLSPSESINQSFVGKLGRRSREKRALMHQSGREYKESVFRCKSSPIIHKLFNDCSWCNE